MVKRRKKHNRNIEREKKNAGLSWFLAILITPRNACGNAHKQTNRANISFSTDEINVFVGTNITSDWSVCLYTIGQ